MMTAPMPETMSPREKVEYWLSLAMDSGLHKRDFNLTEAVDAILAALAPSGDHDPASKLQKMQNAPATSGDHADHSGGVTDMVDHAELARLAEAAEKTPTNWECDTEDGQAFIAAASPATVLSLLSEIAALRIQVDTEKRLSVKNWNVATARATQAERQRDELLSFVRKLDCECDPSFSTASCGRCVQLANQGADQ